METKKFIWIGVTVGSFIGGVIPSLWGSNPFSFTSWLLGAIGAIVGIWLGYQISRRF